MINIMLVEDDVVDVMAVQRMFKRHHVTNPLCIAANGLEALAILHERHRRSPVFTDSLLILLDSYMPRMNGLEFLAELQHSLDFRKIPVVAFMTSDEIRSQMEACHSNIAGYLDKPMVFSQFSELVKCDFADLALSLSS